MFIALHGNLQDMRSKAKSIADNYHYEYSHTKNITSDIKKQYGLLFKPKALFFTYDDSLFPNKDICESFLALADKTKSIIICGIEEIDKKGSFYKHIKKQIEEVIPQEHSTLFKAIQTKFNKLSPHETTMLEKQLMLYFNNKVDTASISKLIHIKDSFDAKEALNFPKNMNVLKTVPKDKVVSFLYSVYYDFKLSRYKQTAGYIINLILEGKLPAENGIQFFILLSS